ncbi:dynein heavy chain 3, axonemal-like [Centruroides sculpturatus]|uniref:dynein heavy chain 3, axonemal-like n=1 Tax=Centruroides sculpturatus TaxID=218467 RepID=UPI000C6E3B1A|nr:dynein heavy chain 3, axonemal-like [Centruroides sculpturatus]
MYRLLYYSVIENLERWIMFLKNYKEENKLYEDLKQRELFNPSLIIIKVVIKNQKLEFEPKLNEIKENIEQFIKEIISTVKNIPRVEKIMFPEMADDDLYLLSIDINDINVKKYISEVEEILQENLSGPDLYLKSCSRFLTFIDGTAAEQLQNYLSSNPSIESIKNKLIDIKKISEEMTGKPNIVHLNLFCLDCSDLNKYLILQAENLWNSIINFKLEENRSHVKMIYDSYDEMSKKLTMETNNIAELVKLSLYLNECINILQHQLMEEVRKAWESILFLLDYPVFTDYDIQMNTKIFNWPSSITKVFNACKIRVSNQQDQAERSLITRQQNLHKNLKTMKELLDSFRTRENLNPNQISNSILELDTLQRNLIEAKVELEKINEEERLLGWVCTKEPLLYELTEQIQPYSQLWHTAYDFTTKFEKWFNGPFNDLNTEEIDESMEKINESLTYLKDIFEDNSAPKHITTYLKKKYSEFHHHVPLLKVVCNPGMKIRHWAKIGLIIGKSILPSEKTSLSDMVQLELGNHISKISIIMKVIDKKPNIVYSNYDIQMNTKIFNWPSSITKVFNACKIRVSNQQDQAERSLITRQQNLHKNLKTMKELLDSFRTRENLNPNQISNSILELDTLQRNLIEAKVELEKINEEERLLGWVCTKEPLLYELTEQIQPYSQLWHTAYDFTTKFEKWFNGPFNDLNTEEIDESMEKINESLTYLKDIFEDNSAPKHITTYLKKKYSEFHHHVPLLKVVCNPGMKIRHWAKDRKILSSCEDVQALLDEHILKIQTIGGSPFSKPLKKELNNWETTLILIQDILDAWLKCQSSWIYLEPIFSSEDITRQMPEEAQKFFVVNEIQNNITADLDRKILSSCEDVQALLDEHILKIQTIGGSPFSKPLKKELNNWETTLILIQDILDAWLKVNENNWHFD